MHGMRVNQKKNRPPHIARIPKGSVSPTGSIYKRFDIVEQGSVLCSYANGPYTIRSLQPFKIRVSVNGKIKEIESKLELQPE